MAGSRGPATRAGIRTSARSSPLAGGPSASGRNAPLPPAPSRGRGPLFGAALAPLRCQRRTTRPVSCYALFRGWLLSQPPGCLGRPTAFPTRARLGGLSRGSGLFPSRRQIFAPAVSLPLAPRGIRGLVGVGKRQAPRPSAPYLHEPCPRRAEPQSISGEPAISGFDWHFTPYPQLIRAILQH